MRVAFNAQTLPLPPPLNAKNFDKNLGVCVGGGWGSRKMKFTNVLNRNRKRSPADPAGVFRKLLPPATPRAKSSYVLRIS